MTRNTSVIDMHSHVLPKPLIEAIAARPREHDIEVVRAPLECGYLVDRVGTDAPCDMGEENPLGMLEQLTGLTNQQRDLIHGSNALALLGEGQA